VTSAIDHAVASHTLTGDQALTLLVGISAGGNGSVQTVAHAGGGASARNDVQTVVHEEISALVHHKALTLDHAFEVLAGLPTGGSSNLQHAIGGAMCALMMDERTNKLEGNVDHAISVLAGIAARGDANFQIALGGEIAGLISALRSQHAALEVMGAIDHAVASQNLTAGQAIMLFAGIAVHGDSQLESAAGRGIAMLIANHQMTSVEAQADIDKAVTAHILTPVQAETLWRACNPHAGFDIALNRAV
jgi:hypothetical protein